MNFQRTSVNLQRALFSGTALASILGGMILTTNNLAQAGQYKPKNQEIKDIVLSQVNQKKINGWNVKSVSYNWGFFTQSKFNYWIEKNNTGVYRFYELGRDQWSVYLKAVDRPVYIQLDLSLKEVKYLQTEKLINNINSLDDNHQSVLYKINHAENYRYIPS